LEEEERTEKEENLQYCAMLTIHVKTKMEVTLDLVSARHLYIHVKKKN